MIKTVKVLVSIAVSILLLAFCAGFAYADGSKIGIVTGNDVNVREQPNASAKVLTQLSKDKQVTIIETSDGWYKISFNNLNGWISSKYVTVKEAVETRTGTITGESVNVRSKADLSSDVLVKLSEGEKVSVLDNSGEWYKIKTSAGTVGWVFDKYIAVKSTESVSRGNEESTPAVTSVETDIPAKTSTTESTGTEEETDVGQQIVDYAKKYLGVKYVWSGSSPKGFDCSGFTMYVYDHFGINLDHNAAGQAAQGTKVSKANLKPGDLVFFDTNGGKNGINHAGLYIGDGKFIHASSGRSARKVVISSLSDSFYSNCYMTARRYNK